MDAAIGCRLNRSEDGNLQGLLGGLGDGVEPLSVSTAGDRSQPNSN